MLQLMSALPPVFRKCLAHNISLFSTEFYDKATPAEIVLPVSVAFGISLIGCNMTDAIPFLFHVLF